MGTGSILAILFVFVEFFKYEHHVTCFREMCSVKLLRMFWKKYRYFRVYKVNYF